MKNALSTAGTYEEDAGSETASTDPAAGGLQLDEALPASPATSASTVKSETADRSPSERFMDPYDAFILTETARSLRRQLPERQQLPFGDARGEGVVLARGTAVIPFPNAFNVRSFDRYVDVILIDVQDGLIAAAFLGEIGPKVGDVVNAADRGDFHILDV